MSDIWLVLAIGCVFGAIVLLGIFVDLSQSERRRAVRLLESQVAGTTSENVNLREQHLSESFGSRILVPVVAGAARVARRVTPIDARDRVARKLLLAGSPAGWDAERLLAFKIIGVVAGVILGVFLTTLIGGVSPLVRIVMIGLLAFVGFVVPDSMINRRVDERQKEILRTLS